MGALGLLQNFRHEGVVLGFYCGCLGVPGIIDMCIYIYVYTHACTCVASSVGYAKVIGSCFLLVFNLVL